MIDEQDNECSQCHNYCLCFACGDCFKASLCPVCELNSFKNELQKYGMVKLVRCLKNECMFVENKGDTYCDLIIGQTYILIVNDNEDKHGMVRVIDGSGESYLYPLDYFEEISN